MAETLIYQHGDVTITTSKVVFGGNTYFTRNIASVRVLKVPNRLAGYLLLGGLVCIGVGLTWFQTAWHYALVGAVMLYVAFRSGFFTYWIHFDTASGAVNAYKGTEKAMQELKGKIEEAMVQRD
jgi:Family of unknown function (DUF6232)